MPRKPTIPKIMTGKTALSLRLPNVIYKPLAERALATDTTVTALIIKALRRYLS